jgi:hypothetical protein
LVAEDPEGVLACGWQTNTVLICFHLSLQAVTEENRKELQTTAWKIFSVKFITANYKVPTNPSHSP